MKLVELQEQDKQKGTYAGVHFHPAVGEAVQEYCKDNNIPNPVPAEKVHTTVLYSRKPCPNFKPLGELNPPWTATPGELEVWPSQSGSRCLVLKTDSPDLVDRHNYLIDEHDATHDYDEYKTHITLSYDIGDMEIEDLPPFVTYLDKLPIVEEYYEPLDTDWAMNNTGDSKD